jgi:hypothetical protein
VGLCYVAQDGLKLLPFLYPRHTPSSPSLILSFYWLLLRIEWEASVVAQVLERLPSGCETLKSNPRTTKKKKKKNWMRKLDTSGHACNPIHLRGWDQENHTLRPAWADSLQVPISKITRAKWTGGVVQGIEHLLCKCETLSSNSLKKKKLNES